MNEKKKEYVDLVTGKKLSSIPKHTCMFCEAGIPRKKTEERVKKKTQEIKKVDYIPLYHFIKLKHSRNAIIYYNENTGLIMIEQEDACLYIDKKDFKEFANIISNISKIFKG